MTTAKTRQPIVAVLGHVDHGKTTLLDYIRKTHLQAKEVGGITQSIGAYQAEYQGKLLTFIDTPGHAAFSQMRSQGAQVADVAILVVAADDGVQPQTVESISHLKAANIPFLVAINKIDKPDANPEKVKAQLTEHQVFVEGYGGNVPVVAISAKTGENVAQLLETLLLLAELEELPYKPHDPLQAPLIEVSKDTRRGIVVTAIVKAGTLHLKDNLFTPTASGKARALFSDTGQSLNQVLPGQPVQILGFKDLPKVGEIITTTPPSQPSSSPSASPSPSSYPSLTQSSSSPRLKLILKASTQGALEAIKNSLPEEIELVHVAPGNINESDVLLAKSTSAVILGFAVKTPSKIKRLAEDHQVTIHTYDVIYELLDFLEEKILKLLDPTVDEQELGQATILKVFDFGSFKVAGCRVEKGRLQLHDYVHLKKRDKVLADARITSLKIGKQAVNKVPAGSECGLVLTPQLDIQEKYTIIAYNKKESHNK